MLLSEGASGNKTVWRKVSHIPFIMLRKRWQATLLDLLHQNLGSQFYSLKSALFRAYSDGFYVYAKPSLSASSLDAIKYIVRYTGRPAMAQSRILDYAGSFLTFYYDRHEDGQRVVEKIHVFEFFKRLIIHIPEEQFKMVRYYGLYAKKYKHSSKLFLLLSYSVRKFNKDNNYWRVRLLLSFGIDPLRCSCGHIMTFIDIFLPKRNPYLANPPPSLYNSA
jgi:hypothetical protein